MPIVNIPGIGSVRFPDSMSDEEIYAKALQMKDARDAKFQIAPPDPRELGIGTIGMNAFMRGAGELGSTFTDLLPAGIASLFGADEYARQQLEEAKEKRRAREVEYPTAFKSYKEIEGPGDLLKFGVETIGEQGANLATMLVPGGIGGVGARALATRGIAKEVAERGLTGEAAAALQARAAQRFVPAAGVQGQLAGVTAGSAAQNIPETFQGIYEETGKIDPGVAIVFGALNTALDSYLPARLIGQFSPAMRSAIAFKLAEKSNAVPPTYKLALAKEFGKLAASEGLTEAAQESISILAEQVAGSTKGFSPENIDRIIDAALKGAIGGAGIGAPGAFVQAARDSTAPPAQPPATPPAQPAAAVPSVTPPAQPAAPAAAAAPATPTGAPLDPTERTRLEELMAKGKSGAQLSPEERAEWAALEARKNIPVVAATSVPAETSMELPSEEEIAKRMAGVPEPAVTKPAPVLPPAQPVSDNLQPIAEDPYGFKAAFASIKGGGVSEDLINGLFQALQQNKTTFAGVKDPILERARPAYQQGLIKSPADLRAFIEGTLALPTAPKPTEATGAAATPATPAAPTGQSVQTPSGVGVQPTVQPGAPADTTPGVGGTERGTVGMGERPVTPATGGETEKPAALTPRPDETQESEKPPAPKGKAAAPAKNYAEQVLAKYNALSESERDAVAQKLGTTRPQLIESEAIFNRTKDVDKAIAEVTGRTAPAFTPGPDARPAPIVVPKSDPAIERIRKLKRPISVQKDVLGYFDGRRSYDDALNLLAYDIAHPRVRTQEGVQEAEDRKEVTYPKQTATAAQKWINTYAPNLKPALDKKVAEKKAEYEGGTKYVEKFTTKQEKLTEKERAAQAAAQRRAEQAPARAKKKAIEEVTEQVEEAKAAPTEQEEARTAEREAIAAEKEAEVEAKEERKFDLERAERESKAAAKAAGKGKGAKYVSDEEVDALLKAMDRGELEAPAPIGKPVSDAVATALKNNDLNTALAELGKTDPRARALANAGIASKVEVVKDLKNAEGKSVPGYYDPKTDTVYLDPDIGLNDHTVIHEAAHAALSHTLDNPSHPATKQIQAVFDKVVPELPTYYGSQNLQEFAAEAMSNADFRLQLARMHPNGDPISAWQRFSRAVINFMRRLMGMDTRPVDSALDAVDRLLLNTLSPAPATRSAEALYSVPATPEQYGDWLYRATKEIEARIGTTPARAKAVATVSDWLSSGIKRGTKKQVLRTLDLYTFADLAKKYIPEAEQVARLEQERDGRIQKLREMADPITESLAKWAQAHPDKFKTFRTLVTQSTLFRINPTKERVFYGPDPEQLGRHAWLVSMYNEIGPDGQKQYNDLLKAYAKYGDQIKASLHNRIANDYFIGQPGLGKRIADNLFNKLTERGDIDPYFPLYREGSKGLTFNARDPNSAANEYYVMFFETDYERKKFIEHLKARPEKEGVGNIQEFEQFTKEHYRNAPSTSFVGRVLADLTEAKVDEAIIEDIMGKYVSLLPESSILKSYQRRKDVQGAVDDPLYVFKKRSNSMAYQIGNIEYGAKLNGALREAEKNVLAKTQTASTKERETLIDYLEGLQERVNLINSPPDLKLGRLLNSLSYVNLLGFNLSSGLVQFAQIPMVVLPRLGGVYGYDKAMKAISDATRVFMSSGSERQVESLLGKKSTVKNVSRSLDNYDFSKHPELAHLETLAKKAADRGLLQRSSVYEQLDVGAEPSALDKLNYYSGYFMHTSERMNRQISLIAAYNLELEKLKGRGVTGKEAEEQAANQAIYEMQTTNGGVSSSSAAPLAQSSNLLRTMFMFKRYGLSMAYMQFKMAREIADPKVRAAALKQLAGTLLISSALAGVRGMPMMGVVAIAYNALKDDDEEDFDTVARSILPEFVFKGVINSLLNIDVSGRIALTDLIIRESKGPEPASFLDAAAGMFMGPIYGVAGKIVRGAELMNEGYYWRGVETMLPTAIGSGMKAYRYATEGTTTLRGDPITGEVSPYNVAAQFFGFAPADYMRQLEVNSALKGIDKAVNEKKTKLLTQYYTAFAAGDVDAASEAREELQKLVEDHPGIGRVGDMIARSIRTRKESEKRRIAGVTYSKGMLPEIRALADELNED